MKNMALNTIVSCGIALMCLSAQSQFQTTDIQILDLTLLSSRKDPEPRQKFTGAVGTLRPMTFPRLPLRLTLGRIERDASKGGLAAEFTVTNSSSENFIFPVSMDWQPLKGSGPGRRKLLFLVRRQENIRAQNVTAVTFSSFEHKSSFVDLLPGKAIRIRLPIAMRQLEDIAESPKSTSIDVRVVLILWAFDDNSEELITHAPFPDAVSENSVAVKIR